MAAVTYLRSWQRIIPILTGGTALLIILNVLNPQSIKVDFNQAGLYLKIDQIEQSIPALSKIETRETSITQVQLHQCDAEVKHIAFLKGYANNGIHTSFKRYNPDECGGCKCRFSSSSKLSYKTADMEVFFVMGLVQTPPERNPDHLWVFLAEESQRSLGTSSVKNWDTMFNYSLMFGRASETRALGLSYAAPFRMKSFPTKHNYAELKRNMSQELKVNALWFISNCANSGPFVVQSARSEYAIALSEFVHIDAYTKGKACLKPLERILRKKKTPSQEPNYKDYWFYLAFENSLCKDYISEKFWKILSSDALTIPIVLGGSSMEDYERIAPPNSYIHVYNFSSVEKLAEHLEYVVENDDAFNYYQQWRNDYEFHRPYSMPSPKLCYLCQLAHTKPHRVWETFSTDFNQGQCIDLSKPVNQCQKLNISC